MDEGLPTTKYPCAPYFALPSQTQREWLPIIRHISDRNATREAIGITYLWRWTRTKAPMLLRSISIRLRLYRLPRAQGKDIMNRRCTISNILACLLTAITAFAQSRPLAVPSGLTCAQITQTHADASAGIPNINHDGTPIAGTPAPDISRGFQGIPRSAQPVLTASQARIWECTYHFVEANTDMPYTLFIPSSYTPGKPMPLVVDLHGLNITPLQQILFDGTADFAEKFGFIVLAPTGFNLSAGWEAAAERRWRPRK